MTVRGWWEREIRAIAGAYGVSAAELEDLVGNPESGADIAAHPARHPGWSHDVLSPRWRRVLIGIADSLERTASTNGSAEDAGIKLENGRSGLRLLAQLAEIFGMSGLRSWAARLAESGDLPRRSRGGARILREACKEIEKSAGVASLRDRPWEWPRVEPQPREIVTVVFEAETEVEAVSESEAATAPDILEQPEEPAAETEPEVTVEIEMLEISEQGEEENVATGRSDVASAPMPETVTVAEPPRPVVLPAPRRVGLLHALVADGSAIARAFLGRLLEEHGVDVVAIGDADQAERVIAGRSFDVLFLDLSMSPGGGADLLRSHPEWSARAILTGAGLAERQRAATLGVPFLLKPVSEEELTSLLAGLRIRRDAGPQGPRSGPER